MTVPASAAARLTVSAIERTVDLWVGPDATPVGKTPKREVARFGRAALHRYASAAKNRRGTPVLLVYALVNKPTIFDLMPGRSVVETLLAEGRDVFLLDWGVPTLDDADMGLEEHILGILDDAVAETLKEAGRRKLSLVGYCMGGTLSVLYTALRPAAVERLFVMAAPIAGRIPNGILHTLSHPMLFDPGALSAHGLVPPEALNLGFAMLRPVENLWGKYVRFYEHGSDPKYREPFLAMERWIREGVPLPGAIYEEFVRGIYQEDRLRRGGLKVGSELADPKKIRCPLGILVAEQDHLVPPASTLALAELVSTPKPAIFRFKGGHVGLAVSGRAHEQLWPEVAQWLIGPKKRGVR